VAEANRRLVRGDVEDARVPVFPDQLQRLVDPERLRPLPFRDLHLRARLGLVDQRLEGFHLLGAGRRVGEQDDGSDHHNGLKDAHGSSLFEMRYVRFSRMSEKRQVNIPYV
jgi:hypothetical protein